jgi:centractin
MWPLKFSLILSMFPPFSHQSKLFWHCGSCSCHLMHINSTSSRYSSGRTTGIVLDSGDGVTHAVPVFEGYSMPHAIRRVDVAGRYVILTSYLMLYLTTIHRDVTDNLQLLLRKSGHHLHTSAEREVVRTIKEKCCYVALNPAKEEKDALGRNEEFRLPDGNVVQVCMSYLFLSQLKIHSVVAGS